MFQDAPDWRLRGKTGVEVEEKNERGVIGVVGGTSGTCLVHVRVESWKRDRQRKPQGVYRSTEGGSRGSSETVSGDRDP